MLENFEEKLYEYAHLLVEVGINIQPGQPPESPVPWNARPWFASALRLPWMRVPGT